MPLALAFFCRAFALTLFGRAAVLHILLFQHRTVDCAGTPDPFRNGRLTNDIANRPGSKRSASGFRNDINFWPLVDDHPLASAIEVAVNTADVIDDACAIDDGGVIDDDDVGTNAIMEMMDIDEDEQRRRQHCAPGAARSPADIIRRFTPGYPGRRPFSGRDPTPSVARIIDPGAVMVTGP